MAARAYRSPRRAAQAAQTRSDLIDAAVAEFSAAGWSATLPSIAARAGVSADTVHAVFGTKKALLRAAIEVAVVGDGTVPLAERDALRSLAERAPDGRLALAVALNRELLERSGGLSAALAEAASSDAEAASWVAELERTRRLDVSRSFELVLGRPLDNRTLDLLWALLGPEVYRKLRGLGWSADDYEALILEAARRILGV